MSKLNKDNVRQGQFMTTGWSPECRGQFVGSQDTSYEEEFVERPAPRRPMGKSSLPDNEFAEIRAQHGDAIAEIRA